MVGGDLLSAFGDDPSLAVEVAVGHEGWRYGEIMLAVGAKAVVDVRQMRSGEEREWQAPVEPDRVRALGRRLAELGLDTLAPPSVVRDPDDDPVRVTVRRHGAAVQETRFRYSQRFDDPRLDAVLDEWQQVVEDVTAGQLPYGADEA